MAVQFQRFATGAGPHSSTPILLVHGMGSADTVWKPIIPALQEFSEVITCRLPGHGGNPLDPKVAMDPFSLAEHLSAEMVRAGIERAHVVGNSLGGWIVLELAGNFPERVETVTALAPAGLWLHPFFIRVPGTDAAKRIANSTNKFAHVGLRLGIAQKLGFSRVSPRWKEISYETMLDATRAMAQSDGYYPAWDAFLDKRFDTPINQSIPITVLFGDKDRALPAKTCQERSLLPPHARWVILENSGHAPMWDSPSAVVNEIAQLVTA
ncbi:MAG: alpha/beta fold hydrolase [Actinobacteria bacterium]|nr:alpha/beta fold hydrolase [Actinomycetota bacterium]